jgi:hypothetical protein
VLDHLSLLLALLLAAGSAASAQEVIRAKDYSGFMRGTGYGWPDFVPVTNLGPLDVTLTGTNVVLQWGSPGILQAARKVTGPWMDVAGASSPYTVPPTIVLPPMTAQSFYRLRGVAAVHSGVGAGCPQQGFDFTGLPGDHWANHPASSNACGWIVPQEHTGFVNKWIAPPYVADFVRVLMRSFNVSNNWTWWLGSPATAEDDAIHQNDGWFHFRVRHPYPERPPAAYRLRFELDFDNYDAFPSGPPQLNYWWVENTWDWEPHDGRCIYTPMYRIKDLAGVASPWQHIAETNVFPSEGYTNAGRHYRCVFEQMLPATAWSEVEVAQNLPYTLDDRDAFLRTIQTNYVHRYNDLCLRKKHLGYGGLFYATNIPASQLEFNELYAIELFKKVPGSESTPALATNRIVVVLAGMDYEPAGNFVAEGVLLEILDHWATPGRDYRDLASYVVFLIGNPDGYEWGTCHVVPYGNGYGGTTNVIHRAHMSLEPESAMPDAALDPEALALRNYFRALTARGLDGRGGQIVTLLDFQNDLCPHTNRWQQQAWFFPPIWGFLFYSDTGQSNAAIRLLSKLREESSHPYTSRYVRNPASPQGWEKVERNVYGIPLWLLFEFDASVVYSRVAGPPGGWQGAFANPIMLPGSGGGPTFYVHGYVDQIGQATAGDPAHVLKLFGRDIIDAARRELLP